MIGVGGPPVIVTGMPRSGTSWVGKMLQLSGEVVYVNEPMNPSHPPGRSPGVLNADVEHYFHYIGADEQGRWSAAFARTAQLRYNLLAELRRNRGFYDLARAAKYEFEFTRGRWRGRRALIDDPYAVVSAAWLAERLGASVVVLVRDPVALVASWRRLGWSLDPAELLAQPALMREHLGAEREQLQAAARSQDPIERITAVWRAVYTVVLAGLDDKRLILRRYEDLAARPVAEFTSLFAGCGLRWSEDVETGVRAATSAPSGQQHPRPGDVAASAAGGFHWSWRMGLSRTAFRPMDSAVVASGDSGLPPATVAQIRARTADIEERICLQLV